MSVRVDNILSKLEINFRCLIQSGKLIWLLDGNGDLAADLILSSCENLDFGSEPLSLKSIVFLFSLKTGLFTELALRVITTPSTSLV